MALRIHPLALMGDPSSTESSYTGKVACEEQRNVKHARGASSAPPWHMEQALTDNDFVCHRRESQTCDSHGDANRRTLRQRLA